MTLSPLLAALTFAGCSSGEPSSPLAATTSEFAPSLSLPDKTQKQQASKAGGCAHVAQAYVAAINSRNFKLAAQLWDSVKSGADEVEALRRRYDQPALIISTTFDGSPASTHCTAVVALFDRAKGANFLRPGKIRLRRSPPSILGHRWLLESSTFAEEMERVGEAAPV